MPENKICVGCGRHITKNCNCIEGDNRLLCSFCTEIENKIWKQKKEQLKKKQPDPNKKSVYCLGCGVEHRAILSFDGYCFECDKKRVKMLEQNERILRG